MTDTSVSISYTPKQIAALDAARLPQHIAIIMDGNRRWAQMQNLPSLAGHWAGAQTLTHIIRAAGELGIKIVTVYAFSTENWIRPQEEVEGLLELTETYLVEQRSSMIKEGVRLGTIGDLSRFPSKLLDVIEETKTATSKGNTIDLVLALNYGGRDDIKRALSAIAKDFVNNKISNHELTEQTISKYLDTAKWQDPDLLIRTSGEMRLSNFLLWQASYAEMYVTEVLWPDFTSQHLYEAVLDYQRRNRRVGA